MNNKTLITSMLDLVTRHIEKSRYSEDVYNKLLACAEYYDTSHKDVNELSLDKLHTKSNIKKVYWKEFLENLQISAYKDRELKLDKFQLKNQLYSKMANGIADKETRQQLSVIIKDLEKYENNVSEHQFITKMYKSDGAYDNNISNLFTFELDKLEEV